MKPYVICHMCTTIDGRILNDRWGKLPGPKDVGTLFEITAASFGIGAWLVGTTTMKEFAGRNVKLPRRTTHRPPRLHPSSYRSRFGIEGVSDVQEAIGAHLWILRKTEGGAWRVAIVAWSAWDGSWLRASS